MAEQRTAVPERPGIDSAMRGTARSSRIFAILCAMCVVVGVGYVGNARLFRAGAAGQSTSLAHANPEGLLGMARNNMLLFRSLMPGEDFGKIAFVPLQTPMSARIVADAACDRFHFAAGHGLCLTANVGTFWSPPIAFAFGEDFARGPTFPIGELPSRVRVAPDGRHAAMTVFTVGDSYADASFSTRTSMVDLNTGEVLGDLERFDITRDGAPFTAVDFNFWGVTFAGDSNRFFVTLGTGGTTYLVEGDLAVRHGRVLRAGVECPSLSPDNTRIAFKHRMGKKAEWRLHILNLATLEDHPTAETRGFDDQAEWLDDSHVIYGLTQATSVGNGTTTDLWTVPADGRGAPRIVVTQAASPAIRLASPTGDRKPAEAL